MLSPFRRSREGGNPGVGLDGSPPTRGWRLTQLSSRCYIRYRLNSGWGPVIIVQELLDKGVLQALIDEQMVLLAEDWVLRADQVRQKKFGSGLPKTFAEEVKQKRFLQYKGFTLDQIDRIFKSKFWK